MCVLNTTTSCSCELLKQYIIIDCVTTSSSDLSSSPVLHSTLSTWSCLIYLFRRSISTIESLPVFKILLTWYARCCFCSSNSPLSFQYWCILFLYPIFGPFFACKLHNIAILLSFFDSFDLYLPMGHLPGKKPSPSVPTSFTPLFYDFLLDIWLMLSVVLMRCHNHQYFYWDTISTKVTDQG